MFVPEDAVAWRAGRHFDRGPATLTEVAGPRFEAAREHGVRRLVVTGAKKPTIGDSDGKVTIEGDGIKASFAGTIEQSRESVIVRLP